MLSIGLMSGTSMDGIDAALLATDGEDELRALGNIQLKYDLETKWLLKALERATKAAHGHLLEAAGIYLNSLQDYLRQELQINPADVDDKIAELTTYLQQKLKTTAPLNWNVVVQLSTQLHADAVKKLLEATSQSAPEIDVIGYHGQTLFHHPEQKISIQIGDGKQLAQLTGITVINDFRRCDIAAGGQGAPFAPIYHWALAKKDQKTPVVVANCGGIANISLITRDCLEDLIGFDTGPGNGLIDALIRQRTGGQESMDVDGKYGLYGKISEAVLEALHHQALPSRNDYLKQKPPKSLDIRDMQLIPELDALSLEDACATLEAFTAKTMVESLELVDLSPEEIPRHWILAGGGWYNPVILRELTWRLQSTYGSNTIVETADAAGWNHDAMEAQIFAYFALRSLKNLSLSLPKTTGVSQPLSGGHAYLPPQGATREVQTLISKNPDVLHGYIDE